MNIEICAELSEKDSDDLFHWRERVFPVEGKGIEWSRPSRHIVCRSDAGIAIGHIGFGEYTLISAGRRILVIGVGGVVVRPEHQGKGIPAVMFDTLHRELSAPVSVPGDPVCFTLFCPRRLESYYAKHGYQVYAGPVEVIQKNEPVTVDFSFMFRGDCNFGETIVLTCEPW